MRFETDKSTSTFQSKFNRTYRHAIACVSFESMVKRLLLGFFSAGTLFAIAGGGPLNTLVVVNDADLESLEIGRRYAHARGIPESHIVHVHTLTNGVIGIGAWSNQIRNPILGFIQSNALTGQIDYVVFSHAFPYRIWNTNIVASPTNWLVASLTSSMYYDFYASSNAFAYGCHLNPRATNAYYKADRAFSRGNTPNQRYLISAYLTGYSADGTRETLRRAASVDGLSPSGRIDLVRTSDGIRSVRWPQHEEADFRARLFGKKNEWSIRLFDPIPIATNLMGYQTGRDVVFDLFNQRYLPGSYADHLTSYGGILDGPNFQTRILDWLKAGAAGSYGTVVEPCAYTEKFPDALIYHWYERGFSLGESLYMSVSHPYQGLFVGDPLVAPYARAPTVLVQAPSDGDVVSGVVTLQIHAIAFDDEHPVGKIDLFIDDRHSQTVLEYQPLVGNTFYIQAPDATAFYTVLPGDDLYSSAAGLAASLNLLSTVVTAKARGDSIELQWNTLGQSASNQSLSAWAVQGLATDLQVRVWAPHSTFLDPLYSAHEILRLRGNAVSGDTVVATITLTNGLVVTNVGFAEAPMGALFLLFRLQQVINSNVALQGPEGVAAVYLRNGIATDSELVLAARTPGVGGTGIHVNYQINKQTGSTLNASDAFQDFFNDNEDTMRPRALVRLAAGRTNAAVSVPFDTTLLPNGPVKIDIVAYDGTAVRSQGRASSWLVISNSAFSCSLVAPPAHHHVLRGATVTSIADVANGIGVTTQVQFFIEGKLAGTRTNAPFKFVWSTTNYTIGTIHVQALARTDAGESARSIAHPIVIYTDEDADGLSDQWEIDHFGSITNAAPFADPDSDHFSNLEEFYAGTNPTNASSRLAITFLEIPRLDFSSVTTRIYRIEWTEHLTNAWALATNVVAGQEGTTTWLDHPTNGIPPSGDLRFYRVRTALP